MTDRMKGAWVAFDRDIREDDVEHLVNAIRMLKGVAGVELEVADHDAYMARERVRSDLAWTLNAVVYGLLTGSTYVPESERKTVLSHLERVAEKVRGQRS